MYIVMIARFVLAGVDEALICNGGLFTASYIQDKPVLWKRCCLVMRNYGWKSVAAVV